MSIYGPELARFYITKPLQPAPCAGVMEGVEAGVAVKVEAGTDPDAAGLPPVRIRCRSRSTDGQRRA